MLRDQALPELVAGFGVEDLELAPVSEPLDLEVVPQQAQGDRVEGPAQPPGRRLDPRAREPLAQLSRGPPREGQHHDLVQGHAPAAVQVEQGVDQDRRLAAADLRADHGPLGFAQDGLELVRVQGLLGQLGVERERLGWRGEQAGGR